MTPRRRALMMRVMDSKPEILPYLHFLDRFARCDDILRWLIENRLTGQSFLEWAKQSFDISMMNMASFVLKRVEKDNSRDIRPIIMGKDFLQ
jgi:hypothetical protein